MKRIFIALEAIAEIAFYKQRKDQAHFKDMSQYLRRQIATPVHDRTSKRT